MQFFSLIDLLVFGGSILVVSAVTLLAVFTDQSWDITKILVLACVYIVTVLIDLIFLFKGYFSKPDFITRHGTKIWIGKCPISVGDMNDILDFYIERLPKLCKVSELAYPRSITVSTLQQMLNNASIVWSDRPPSVIGIGWCIKEAAGFQRGKQILLHFKDNLLESALFHELHHMIDEIILGVKPDYKHERTQWWNLVPILKQHYRMLKSGS